MIPLCRYTSELASGLAYLHSHDLVHLDVKPANALLTRHGHLKLADFGCCARIDNDEDPVLGTVVYQAPEVLRGGAAGPHSDVFSLGVTIWHMLTRSTPYQGIHPHVVLFQVVHLRHRPTDHHPQESTHTTTTLEALLWHLARSCWAEEPEDRPAVSDLCRTLNAMIMLSPEGGRMFGL
ncbi:proto-oncogene serine/threonine-protein kinase mos-like [Procambarus clarkii]|uniref:proto-oncogene serine/threonine-protein kinase mos-like n=1 Tax=Procambarus clarkii TaxID=6728 RepID=UPI00374266C2